MGKHAHREDTVGSWSRRTTTSAAQADSFGVELDDGRADEVLMSGRVRAIERARQVYAERTR